MRKQLFSNDPRNLQALEEQLGVKATSREGWIKLEGEADALDRDIDRLLNLGKQDLAVTAQSQYNSKNDLAEEYRVQYERQKVEADKLADARMKLEARLHTIKQEREHVLGLLELAKTKVIAAKSMKSLDSLEGVGDSDISRVADAIRARLDRADAEVEMRAGRLSSQMDEVLAARFDRESLEAVTVRYFYDAAVDPFGEDAVVESVPPDLVRRIGFFLVPAGRTWDRTISFGSELFRRVVSYVGGRPAAAVLEERARLRTPEHPMEEDEHLRELVSLIDNDVASLMGTTSRLKLRITSTDSDGILDAVIPHFGREGEVALPSRRQGSGLVSLQTIILLIRFGQLRVAAGDGFMMVIEEPELDVPPPLQRKLIRMMQGMATQVVVTTHSPAVASIPEPHQIHLISNRRGDLSAQPLAKGPLAADANNPTRSLLLSARDATVGALMHGSVIVPEGRLDAAWLRQLTKCSELGPTGEATVGLSFSHEVGVVPTADARVREVYEYLRAIHPSVTCLFDGDAKGNEYTAGITRLAQPPHRVIRWPAGWTIEHLIEWVAQADAIVLRNDELQAMGVPEDPDALAPDFPAGGVALLVSETGPAAGDEPLWPVSLTPTEPEAGSGCPGALGATWQSSTGTGYTAQALVGEQASPDDRAALETAFASMLFPKHRPADISVLGTAPRLVLDTGMSGDDLLMLIASREADGVYLSVSGPIHSANPDTPTIYLASSRVRDGRTSDSPVNMGLDGGRPFPFSVAWGTVRPGVEHADIVNDDGEHFPVTFVPFPPSLGLPELAASAFVQGPIGVANAVPYDAQGNELGSNWYGRAWRAAAAEPTTG